MKNLYFKSMILGILVSVVSLFNVANATVILNVENGQLLGASNIEIDNVLYDVTFAEGTCTALFNGCNEQSDFFWQNEMSASAAAQALLASVFIDGPAGQFDSVSNLTNGCTDSVFCSVFTPFLFELGNSGSIYLAGVAGNSTDEFADSVLVFGNDIDANTLSTATFAIWSVSQNIATDVPEPATFAIFAFGLLGLRWRRKALSK